MAQPGGGGGAHDGLLDMEKELSCSICTDILYQPLTLLDCLHTFCGACLKEWFAFQAQAAAQKRRTASPYTCPSCREHVRGTKADWRLATLLEGYLKANPGRVKSDEEKEEFRQQYKPGDDVIPKVDIRRDDTDSEDERLMEEVRELSMGHVDPESARRRAELRADRAAGHARRRQHAPESMRGSRSPSGRPQLSEARLREHNANEAQVEHQPSLRSLLSGTSITDANDVQQDILQSIYSEGLLEGIDLDNLTIEQEEELTERIADAYRRRQRRRDRSRNQERSQCGDRSSRPTTADGGSQQRHHVRTRSETTEQRAGPPASRTHLVPGNIHSPETRDQRSNSATSQRSNRSAPRATAPVAVPSGARSATDLGVPPLTEERDRERRRRLSSNTPRSDTDPERPQMRPHISHMRASSNNASEARSGAIPPSAVGPLEALRRQAGPTNNSAPTLPSRNTDPLEHSVRAVVSNAAFAPEHISSVTPGPEVALSAPGPDYGIPTINCSRCAKPSIQHDLHYNCAVCQSGQFNLCLPCYRSGQGCEHWYGFGYRAYDRWQQLAPPDSTPTSYERPHILSARRYLPASDPSTAPPSHHKLQEGTFCDSCLAPANECYWHCAYCLDGAWGFCNACVQQGLHCTHPLLPLAHLSALAQPLDPAKASFVPLPHLRPDSYVQLPVLTDCDVCHRPIPWSLPRFHCWRCSRGDYDVCTECYYNLVGTGKISQGNGVNGWRRCLKWHRMVVVGYQDVEGIGQQRVTVRDVVGGRRWKVDDAGSGPTAPPPPPDGSLGARGLALWNYFPGEGVSDELAFPKNAEIIEMEAKSAEWSVGVYGGRIGLFPSNHVRRI